MFSTLFNMTGMGSVVTPNVLAAASPWLQEMGRMHVVIVHFPIALLLVAGIFEACRVLWRSPKFEAGRVVWRSPEPSKTAMVCLALGAVSAIVASVMGWLHSGFSNFSGDAHATLTQHEWLGFITAGIATLTLIPIFFYREGRRLPVKLYRVGAILGAALVGLTGHLGGTLTHGDGYLTELIFTGHADGPDAKSQAVTQASFVQPVRDLSTVHFPADGKIDFLRDVQPIFASTCYECHGPTKRSGALRLDNKESVFKGGNSGPAVVAGKGTDSLLIHRVLGLDNQKRMPVNHAPLADEHTRILTAWIDQGAKWPDNASNNVVLPEQKHWAFVKPVRPELPAVQHKDWPKNPIDYFTLAKMEQAGLEPSPEADRATLIRRVSLDLVGLPPSPEEVDAFVNDPSPDAYDRLVNRLLASPHYGERWGRHWLDVARYADTNGYEKDVARSIWPYRDWVISALNRDMTFDQFVIQQIAGDMLPNASVEEKIATGFHRNTMFNEEGGIDVEEFRFKAIVDRVQTTSTAFLGLTMQCAQCHNHKYDPISQQEYYQFFSLLNNADEPDLKIPDAGVTEKRRMIQASIDKATSELENQFPAHDDQTTWEPLTPTKVTTQNGAVPTTQPDQSILISGPVAEKEVYTVEYPATVKDVTMFRLEVIPDSSLPMKGPGRMENGNFVLTKLSITHTPPGGAPTPVALSDAQADFSQANFNVSAILEGKPETGWAIAVPNGHSHVHRAATVRTASPLPADGGVYTVTLDQAYAKHSIGRFRISAGYPKPMPPTTEPVEQQRKEYLTQKQAEWEKTVAAKSSHWTVVDPVEFNRRYNATITKLPDKSLLFTGDNFYREDYSLEYQTDARNITGIRVEVLPHDALPRNGPGRNKEGGFALTELAAGASPLDKPSPTTQTMSSTADPTTQPSGTPIVLVNPTADVANDAAALTLDGKADTHWKIDSGNGKAHAIVYQFKQPVAGFDGGTRLSLNILQNFYESQSIGRIRVSVTTDATPAVASGLSAEIEQIVLIPPAQRTPEQAQRIKQAFLLSTPLLATQQQAIAGMKASMPQYPTTLVMNERAVPRQTNIHHRGEFLQLDSPVQPGVPAVLHPMPKGMKPDRLALAMWLVDPENPLMARVTINRIWSQYFGVGIVSTVDNFGIMGEKPTNPELLDWLATEFIRQNWSMKAMHRMIVTSATYRQSSNVTPILKEKDPSNALLARAPRLRVEGEIVRDIALAASGLLNERIGGPSVYPPEPPSANDAAYGGFAWTTSEGADRYRRGMYTFFKRSTPYPALMTFDEPTAENTCTRRNRSNTPLQALTTLNDIVYTEAAQHMAERLMQDSPVATQSDPFQLARYAMRLCVGRVPDTDEVNRIVAFYNTELTRFQSGKADANAVALAANETKPGDVDLQKLAAWTMVCRAVLNLDETFTKN